MPNQVRCVRCHQVLAVPPDMTGPEIISWIHDHTCQPASLVVVCEDGHVRHDGDFVRGPDAIEWANWGHICTAEHKIITRDQYEQLGKQETMF